MKTEIKNRAEALKNNPSLVSAVHSGELEQYQNLSTSEALIIGLLNQGVRIFVGIFGHGSTDIGEIMRIYENAGILKTVNVRNEIEASHVAAALRWHYGITPAVFTSIGPGALQAMAGSLTPLSNGLGVYYIFGDETTQSEGPNMQQIPKREQELFLKLTGTMGPSYSIHTPEALFTALKRGTEAVHNPGGEKPFYLLMPMNIQPLITEKVNLLEFPSKNSIPMQICGDRSSFSRAAEIILNARRITVKAGGGARNLSPETVEALINTTGGVWVHGPGIPGLLPASDKRNMSVGGSKGSISGNYALENSDLLIILGARGVCQWDSSGTAFPHVKNIININTDTGDLGQYNRTLPLPGDAGLVVSRLIKSLKSAGSESNGQKKLNKWQEECYRKKVEWESFKRIRYKAPLLYDKKYKTEIITQPAAIKIAVDFADSIDAVKYFDAGDVQANGFQIVQDEIPGRTFTDTGASYMGFAVSALLASALVERPDYPIAFTGDGSFMMNPQILVDAVEFKLHGMILLFDNRRMGAISSLQQAQYKNDYRTDDRAVVDYARMASAVEGVAGFSVKKTGTNLQSTLLKAFNHNGLSLVHIPVHYGENELSGLGAFGNWNVGNWCKEIQNKKHQIGL